MAFVDRAAASYAVAYRLENDQGLVLPITGILVQAASPSMTLSTGSIKTSMKHTKKGVKLGGD